MTRIIFLFLFPLLSCTNVKYKSLNADEIDETALLRKINPDNPYPYWEVNYTQVVSQQTIFSKGSADLKKQYGFKENEGAFFSHSGIIYSGYNINFLDGTTWNYIKTKEGLLKFMGRINNPEEAFLVAEIYGYSIDINNKQTRSAFGIKENKSCASC
jgi:hypothetical protein